MIEEADYVIAGGGSAGCVLANRLSEDPNVRVVLLEVGPPSNNIFWVNLPAGIPKLMPRTDLDWLYMTEPDPTLKNRPVLWFSGRMLGGGSAINGMVYIRGTPYDYDGWAASGCTGWSWNEVLPYFIKSEDFDGPASKWHGKGGPLGVSQLRVIHPLARSFIKACGEVGLREIEDYCSGDIDGAYVNFATQKGGMRCSTARGFLQPVLNRPNLKVITEATVDRVLFDANRASGVRYLHEGAPKEIRVKGEVIISAGTMQSPTILLRSGIGPGAYLQGQGIQVTRASEGVGKNLHEHPSMSISRLTDLRTYNNLTMFQKVRAAVEYAFLKQGILTTCTVHAQAHGRSSPDRERPDIKLQMLPIWHHPDDDGSGKPLSPNPKTQSGIVITVNLMDPKSRGEIRLRSLDPTAKPVIDFPEYSDPTDLERMRLGMRFTNRILEAPSFAKHVVGMAWPPNPNQSDEAWDEHLRKYSRTGLHPVGTCRMGGDEGSVVDPELRVRGVDGLRVADASIIPLLPSANTNAPAIMIGEKCADMVKASRRRATAQASRTRVAEPVTVG